MSPDEGDELKNWTFTAISDTGDRVNEHMLAANEAEVRAAALAANWTVLEVHEVGALSLNTSVSDLFSRSRSKDPKMSSSDLAVFTRQMYQMLKAGIQISQVMESLSEDQRRPEIAKMLKTITERLTNGAPLAEAFGGYPKAFNETFLAYMSAGEDSGELIGVCGQLAHVLEKRAEITRKVRGVAMYPVMVGALVAVMVAAIIVFIVPRYAAIYESLDSELPGPTQMVVSLSKVFPFVVAGIVCAVVVFVSWNKKNKDNLVAGQRLDRLRFKMPVFGKLFHKLALYRFTSTAAGALSAGVSMHNALDLAARASSSRWVRATAPKLQDMIHTGRAPSEGLALYPELYPPILRKMVTTGEDTGEVSAMLRNFANATEDEIDLIISTMGAKLEVVLLLALGVSVGSLLMALYLPILSLSSTAGEKFGF